VRRGRKRSPLFAQFEVAGRGIYSENTKKKAAVGRRYPEERRGKNTRDSKTKTSLRKGGCGDKKMGGGKKKNGVSPESDQSKSLKKRCGGGKKKWGGRELFRVLGGKIKKRSTARARLHRMRGGLGPRAVGRNKNKQTKGRKQPGLGQNRPEMQKPAGVK